MACNPSGRTAVVGIACDLPSGSYSDRNLTYQEFFNFLQDRGEAYEEIPSDRLNIESWQGVGLGHVQVRKGAFLKDIDKFDNLEFGISQNDTSLMSAVTRKLIETCFLALLDSGIDYRGKNVGCYTSGNSFDLSSVSDPDEYMTASFAGYPSMVANRVSYHLDLLGPSLPTDTACSSTVTALHLAVSAILNGDCEAAVVSGCQLNHRFMDWIQYSRGGILSDDGKCKPFDASADGFGRGEACVAIVIKPLEAALRDGDHIYATILSTAINNSGQAAPAGAPVAERQRDAMIEAYRRANMNPKDVDYIELHATGTAKGDPTEANWAGEEFKRDGDVIVGSLKGNIGHTEIASLLASLAKVLHIFEHGIIPPNANFVTPNPAIRWEEYRLRVPTEPLPLRTHDDRPSLISMASSGIGGSNGHVLLEGPPKSKASLEPCSISQSLTLLVAGGLSPRTALAVGELAAEALSDPSCNRASLATVLGRRSKQMAWRTFTIASSNSKPDLTFPSPVLSSRVARPIVFLFSGQGPQHKDMGRQLFSTLPVFRQSIEEMDEVHKRVTGVSLIADYGLFTGKANTPETWPISLILPSITIFQLALYELFLSLGVRPDVVIGHSAGETAVLHACGGAPKAMAVELSIIRGQTFTAVEALGGTMAALSCSAEKTEELIRLALDENQKEVVEIACYNSPTDTAVAGHRSAIERLIEKAKEHDILGRIIRTQVPIHSSMMEACREEYTRRLEDLFRRYPGPHTPSVMTYSTFTGERFAESFEAEYFWKNTRGQVHFTQAMKSLSDLGALTVVEISPHPVLASYTSALVDHSSVVLSSVKRPKTGQSATEYRNLLELCGQLTVNGHNCINFAALNGTASLHARNALPPYPFAKKQFPLYPDTPGVAKQFATRNGPLNHKYLKINKDTHPIIGEHVIRGEPIMPAAGFIEMALEFGATTLMNVEMRSILSLSSDKPVPVQVALDGCYWKVVSTSLGAKDGSHISTKTERLHADGYLSFELPTVGEPIDIPAIRSRCHTVVSEGFYNDHDGSGMGPRFRRLINLMYGDGECLASVNGLDDDLRSDGKFVLHPAVIDACIQASTFKPFQGEYSPFVYYLPAGVQTVQLHQPSRPHCCPRFFYSYLKITEWNIDSVLHDVILTDSTGIPFCTMKGFRIAKHRITPPPNLSRAFDVAWRPLEQSRNDAGKLFHPRSFVFNYHLGDEAELQWLLSGLNPSQTLDIWTLASHGSHGSNVIGLLRAVRREYPLWNFRAVLFPSAYPEETWVQHLTGIPDSLSEEPEIMVSESGEYLVSRLEEVERHDIPAKIVNNVDTIPEVSSHEVLVRVNTKHSQNGSTVLVGTVTKPCDCGFPDGASVVGFAVGSIHENVLAFPSHHLVQIPPCHAETFARNSPQMLPFISAVLALGPSTFRSLTYARSLKVLLTHADTPGGSAIKSILQDHGIPLHEAVKDAQLSELSQLGAGQFDVVISGYEEAPYNQILKTLLKDGRGKLYVPSRLNDLVAGDPCLVQEALQFVIAWLEEKPFHLAKDQHALPVIDMVDQKHSSITRVKYHADRTYIILGGIGSLGLHIALYLYEHGARHIVLTSRSGYKAISRSQNRMLRNMAAHLAKFKDLDLQYTAVDSLSKHAMTVLFQSLSFPLAGCFILTAVLDDSTFLNISEESFSRSRAAKVGVLDVLLETMDVSELDFLVAFSSVSGTIGNSGQANYGAANTSLEEAVRSIPNAFSFICPGVVDSSLMLGTGATEQARVLRTGIPWSMSAEDMILWLDDSLKLFFEGKKVMKYVPDLEWDILAQVHGIPQLARHLATRTEDGDADASGQADHKQIIREIVQQTLNVPASDFEDNIPLTSYGIDSISASRVAFLLRRFVDITQIQLLADISLNDILQKMGDDSSTRSAESSPQLQTIGKQVKVLGPSAMLESQLADLSDLAGSMPAAKSARSALDTVLVTGTTGALGCNILSQLLARDDVTHVFALNRGNPDKSAMDRQAHTFVSQGVPVTLLSSPKLTVLEGDMSLPNFGLDISIHEELLERVTHVIHAAWKVNFGAPVSDFEDLIKGTTNLIRFCSTSNSTLSFISTIGIYLGMHSPSGLPEAPITRPEDAKLPGGYLESKWIAERLVQIQSEDMNIRANVVRVGLITGGLNGIWDSSHWLPTLVESGLHVGCLPEGDGVASWIPIDLAAAAIIECHSTMNETIHIVHPRPVPWNTLIAPIAEDLQLPLVPVREWITRLEHMNEFSNSPRAQKIPAFALLDFYREGARNAAAQASPESMGMLPSVASTKGTASSVTLSNPELPQLGISHVKAWLRYWKDIGFLQ